MTDFLSQIELSVRAERVLRDWGITTYEAFMNVSMEKLMSFKGIGRRTAAEILELQHNLSGDGRRLSKIERLADLVESVNALADEIEDESPGRYKLTFDRSGLLTLSQFLVPR